MNNLLNNPNNPLDNSHISGISRLCEGHLEVLLRLADQQEISIIAVNAMDAIVRVLRDVPNYPNHPPKKHL